MKPTIPNSNFVLNAALNRIKITSSKRLMPNADLEATKRLKIFWSQNQAN